MIDNCEDIIISTNNLAESQVVLSPNPSSGDLNVKLSNNELVQIRIITIEGKLINSTEGRGDISIRGLDTGVYFIQILFADGNSIVKRQVIN